MKLVLSGISLLSIVASTLATLHLMLYYRRPGTAVAWLFALWFLPLAGVAGYVMLAVYEGPRRVRQRRRLSRRLRQPARRSLGASQRPPVDVENAFVARVADGVGALPMTHGNALELHRDAQEAKADVLQLLGSATREILLLTYIWREDPFTESIIAVLREKVARGVRVHVLVDPIGSYACARRVQLVLRGCGIGASLFLEPNPFKGRFQINFRNHRKLLVVDGRVAVTGGRNFAGPYFDDGPSGIRDISMRVEGPAVASLRSVFLEDWVVATDGEDAELSGSPVPQEQGADSLRVIPHGCDEHRDAYLPILGATLQAARKSILIVTPYFVPGGTFSNHLQIAALGGVSVRVLLAERTPERWPEIAARRFFEPLLKAGVELWIRPSPFIHAKAIVVDDKWTFFGSANFDQRSFYLNYELSCEAASTAFAKAVTQYFEPDFEMSKRVDLEAFRKRGLWRKGIENGAALFTPML